MLLCEVAVRLAGALRPTDLVARLGGDAFAVLAPRTETQGAISVAAKLLRALVVPMVIQGQTVTIGASIGIATWNPPQTDASTLLRQADVAMYVGNGNAGFNYLRDVPADQLKINRGIVQHMVNNPAGAVIVRATVDLARGLGPEVVADGVDDSAIWAELLSLGCHLAQGFHICPPVPAAELVKRMALPHVEPSRAQDHDFNQAA